MPFDSAYLGLQDLDYMTLRYAGHFDSVMRHLANGTLREKLSALPGATPDLVLLRVWTEGAGVSKAMVEGVVLGDTELDNASSGSQPEMEPQPVFSAMQHLTGWPTALIAQSLLETRDAVPGRRPTLFKRDHILWSGRDLDDVLSNGGVIMPYELVDGWQMLSNLGSGILIPQSEFRISGMPDIEEIVLPRTQNMAVRG